MLSFERLDVYQRSIQFLAFASEVIEELPRGNSERADQLMRAAEAVPRNIAEGAGRSRLVREQAAWLRASNPVGRRHDVVTLAVGHREHQR